MASHNGHESTMKDVERNSFNGDGVSHEEKVRNALTNAMTLSPELFEKIYLSPKGPQQGDLRKTFANPTPVAITGFVVGLLPLSCEFSTYIMPPNIRHWQLTPNSGMA